MAEQIKMVQVVDAIDYVRTDDLVEDAAHIIDAAQTFVRGAANVTLVRRNWLLGKRIAEEGLDGSPRAAYGKGILRDLSRALTQEYGRGFEQRNLYRFLKFYKTYPDILTSPMAKSGRILSWTHYLALLRVDRRDDDNPTLGIVLCTETSETIARYSVLHGNEQLFAAEYKLCLPTEEELRNEIENQKLMFRLQRGTDGDGETDEG